MNEHPTIKDLTENNGIFTIDSKSCCDYDDALGYQHINETNKHVIRIHANVSLWMDVLIYGIPFGSYQRYTYLVKDQCYRLVCRNAYS